MGGAKAEYEAVAKSYSLPAGDTYPAPPFKDSSGSYQEGYGTQAAIQVWNCDWGKAYLKARGTNETAATHALDVYASVEKTSTYKKFWDPQSIQEPFEKSVAQARLGDPSAIARDIEENCA